LAQEDLWVCQALLRVISNCYEGAAKDKPSTAVVKRIEHLDIGRDAAFAWMEAERALTPGGPARPPGMPGTGPTGPGGMSGPGGAAGPGGMMGPGGMGPGMMQPGMMGPGAGGAGMMQPGMLGPRTGLSPTMTEEQIKQALVAGRYVDDKGMPLPYDAPSTYYVKHPFAEFKLMPVRMSLVMDQRRIPKLLVECANSNMPIEVRRVRILTVAGTTGMPGMAATPAGGQSEDVSSLDIPVEIQAWIYIYNPPDEKNLGKGAASLPAALAPAAGPPITPPQRPARQAGPTATSPRS
jgi:hypothetical protein